MITKNRARTSSNSVIADVWRRELGQLSSRNFANRLAASEDLVLRLDVLCKLDAHHGRANTVSFNASGDILVSGSSREIILWDWESGRVKLSFPSGHSNNVIQAKFMPFSQDRSIVTCAADGQVRHAEVLESRVETKLLAEHHGRVRSLAIEPGSPHMFYAGGVDGLVQHIDLRTKSATSLFTCKSLLNQSFSALNLHAITIDPRNPNMLAVGGSDPFARVYDIRRYKSGGSSEFGQPADCFCPCHLLYDKYVVITGLAFSEQGELLASYNVECIYLFTKDLGLGPIPAFFKSERDVKADLQFYKGHLNCETVKGVNFFGPKCEYVVSGSDCGHIYIWKKKCGRLVRHMEADKHIVNFVEPHPHSPVLASCGIEHHIKMWVPKAIDRAIVPTTSQEDRVAQKYDDSDDFIYSDDDGDGDEDEDSDYDDDDDGDEDEDNDDEGEDDGDEHGGIEVLNEQLDEEEETETEEEEEEEGGGGHG